MDNKMGWRPKASLGLCLGILILFTLPLVDVKCVGETTMRASGVQLALTGMKSPQMGFASTRQKTRKDYDRSFLIIPVAALLAMVFAFQKGKNAKFIQAIFAGGGGVFMIVKNVLLQSKVSEAGGPVSVSLTPAYWGIFIIFICMATIPWVNRKKEPD